MEDKIDKLLKEAEGASDSIKDKLVAIANKVSKKKKYLIIDILEMESIVDPDKVEPMESMERIEVEV